MKVVALKASLSSIEGAKFGSEISFVFLNVIQLDDWYLNFG